MSLAGAFGGHSVVSKLILRFGTEEQRQRYLPRMATGELRATMALTEPDGGSDLQAIRTVARPGRRRLRHQRLEDVDHQRPHVRARRAAVQDRPAARTGAHRHLDPARREGAGVHGVARSAQARVQGRRVVRAALRRLPRAGRRAARRRRGQGLQPDDDRARDRPDPGRRAARSASRGRRSTTPCGTPRSGTTFGVPIWQHQSVGNLLADMATQITAGQQLNYHAADCIDSGRRADMEAGMAKLFCSEMAAKVTPRRDPHPRRARVLDRVRRRALLPRRAVDDRRRRHQRSPPQRHRQAGDQAAEAALTVQPCYPSRDWRDGSDV